MNNEDAIKDIVKETCEGCFYIENCQRENCAFHLAIEALKEKEANKWIPISERLPEPQKPNEDFYNEHWSDFVLVCIDWWNGQKVIDTAFYDFDEKEWVYQGSEESEVIAWKPLPEPYKKK